LSSLSIVIPAYNEEKRLQSTIQKLDVYLAHNPWDFVEILIVDDGSSDGTAALIQKQADSNPVYKLVRNPGNRGKGFAVKNGALSARGEWVLVTDADLSAPIDDLGKLIKAAMDQKADIAIGSRAIDRSLVSVRQPVFREYSGRFFNLVMRALTGLAFKDTQCGFKLFHQKTVQSIFSRQVIEGFGFDVEDLFLARLLGFRTVEVPVRWANVEGTKVSLASGLNGFLDLLRVRWYHLSGRYR
jgi:dolichyl-phosphate beta-glucosyltransferase